MAYILFLDESGHDLVDSPYEVIAGVAIEEKNIWNLIREIHELEFATFGRRYSAGHREIKARKILKKKTFRLANQDADLSPEEIPVYAKRCLDDGARAGFKELTALGMAKLIFVEKLLELCSNYRCKIFASISSDGEIPDNEPNFLRKDYVYLFERYYYFLEDKPEDPSGIIVFDELEKTKSHLLISQIENYFKKTIKGRTRSSLIIPEPFFVHSDLTTGVQIADIIAYLICWGFRLEGMNQTFRKELEPFVNQIMPLRYRTTREIDGIEDFEVWSIIAV